MKSKRAVVLWTGGKDCNLALVEGRKAGYEIVSLVTFAMRDAKFRAHPLSFMEQQAKALRIPHAVISLDEPYRESYETAIAGIKAAYEIETIITGDIAAVHGHTNWITERSKPSGVHVFLPLWGSDREYLLKKIFALKFKVIFSCVKEPWFSRDWLGKELNAESLNELNTIHSLTSLDICGEQGEYHTLVLDGPGYHSEIGIDSFITRQEKEILYIVPGIISMKEKHMEADTNQRKKTCPGCGIVFGCYTENCWCSELPHVMPLGENKDCLCPACLQVEINRKLNLPA